MAHRATSSRLLLVCTAIGAASVLILGIGYPASADTVLDGPVDLGTASTYGVLGASAVTNTGPTVVNGDLGISPGTSVTGFGGAPNGVINGTLHQTDAAAAQAQNDTTTAYNTAAGLTPTTTGLTELSGLSLTPGVYSGGALALSDNGALTLAGSANSVWVFQAASTLTIGSATQITITGGASACNVFWQVGSSATLGTAAQFQGTVLAQDSVTATTSATIVGRLLARTGAVALDTNTITAPTGCPPPGTVSETPTITSTTPPGATTGTPYSFTITATGSPAPTFTITSGALPAGLSLETTTGTITGTPTTAGTSTFTITASNGATPDATATYTLTISSPAAPTTPPGTASGSTAAGELAATGTNTPLSLYLAGGLVLLGATAMTISSIQRRPANRKKTLGTVR